MGYWLGPTLRYCVACVGLFALRCFLVYRPTLRLRLVWGYLRFARFVPSGLLKETIIFYNRVFL